VSFDINPISLLDTSLNLSNHPRTDIAAGDVNRFAGLCIGLTEYFGLTAAPAGIVEHTRMRIVRGQKAEKMKLAHGKWCADCLRDVDNTREGSFGRSLTRPRDSESLMFRHGADVEGCVGGLRRECGDDLIRSQGQKPRSNSDAPDEFDDCTALKIARNSKSLTYRAFNASYMHRQMSIRVPTELHLISTETIQRK
jgi:hypothetical protein